MENSHLAKIEARLQELNAIIEKADSERQELIITKKVIDRLNESINTVTIALVNGKGSPRPQGTPSTFNMVESVLATAETNGKDGLAISEVVDEIRNRYWPGLTNPQIAPLIYQFASHGRIRKTPAGKFKRLQNKEAPEPKVQEAESMFGKPIT